MVANSVLNETTFGEWAQDLNGLSSDELMDVAQAFFRPDSFEEFLPRPAHVTHVLSALAMSGKNFDDLFAPSELETMNKTKKQSASRHFLDIVSTALSETKSRQIKMEAKSTPGGAPAAAVAHFRSINTVDGEYCAPLRETIYHLANADLDLSALSPVLGVKKKDSSVDVERAFLNKLAASFTVHYMGPVRKNKASPARVMAKNIA